MRIQKKLNTDYADTKKVEHAILGYIWWFHYKKIFKIYDYFLSKLFFISAHEGRYIANIEFNPQVVSGQIFGGNVNIYCNFEFYF